jgi:hypothetical protein
MTVSHMADDDTFDDRGPRSRAPLVLALAWFILLAGLLAVCGSLALFGRASDGEPVVQVVLTPPAVHRKAPPKHAAQQTPDTNLIGAGPQPTETPEAGVPGGGQAGTGERNLPPLYAPRNITSPVRAGNALVADPALLETTNQGTLPRIADDGRTPFQAYAPPIAPGDTRPRIAIVISGLGFSAKATSAALDILPPPVTVAFAPYDNDVQRWVSESRRRGHEVLMEVPMEPFDFPDSDPGPHTLRAQASEDENLQRLSWALSRFTGYVGITNLLGGRFMANSDSLAPVMTFLKRRGLMFFDSGSATRSAAPDVAHSTGVLFAESAATIDTIQTGMEIDRRLSELEARARASGRAAGAGFIYPVTVQRVAVWAKGLPGRGFVLVPVSAIVPAAAN